MFKLKSSLFLLLVIVTVLGFFLRFYKLTEYPIQLNHDEITQLYDAISIAQTGKDIYNNFLPTIFVSISDFKPPFYAYATALTFFLTGFNEITIKIPAAFFGALLVPAIFWFTYKLFKNPLIAIFASFITAISPFEIHFSRKGFENGTGIFLMLIGFSAMLSFFENKEKKYLYLGIISLSFSMYTYFSHAAILPFLIIAFILIYRRNFLPVKKFIQPALLFIALIVPLLFIILFNPVSKNRSEAVFVTKDVILQSELNNIQTNNKLADSIYQTKRILEYSFNKYLNQLDPNYLFGKGLGFTNQGPLDMGILFFIQLPLIIMGILYLIRSGQSQPGVFIFFWMVIGLVPSGLTFESYSPHRVIMVFTMFNILSALGLYFLKESVERLFNSNWLKLSTYILVLLFFAGNFLYFIHTYTVNLPFEKSETYHYPFKSVSLFAWENRDKVDLIVFDPNFGKIMPSIGAGAHYYLAFYGGYPPFKMQQEYRLGEKPREVLFDKFSIREVNWIEDSKLKNTLIIASPLILPQSIKDEANIVKVFKFYDGIDAFYAIKL